MDEHMISKKTMLRPTAEPTSEDRIKALETRNEFLENCIAEMAQVVYSV